MITTVIFDIGNVLVDFSWAKHIKSFGYSEEINERIARASVLDTDWNQYDKGDLSEDEIMELFIENDPGIEKELRTTYASLNGIVEQRSYAKELIMELKERGLKVLYLSNFSKKAETDCAKELDFIPLTDGGILSYKERVIKPSQEIYELLTNRYNLIPGECVFLDDTIANVEAARKHGYNAIIFKDCDSGLKELYSYLDK